jgi:hypothetical protein
MEKSHHGGVSEARDFCMQALSLVDLVISMYSEHSLRKYSSHLSTCSSALSEIINFTAHDLCKQKSRDKTSELAMEKDENISVSSIEYSEASFADLVGSNSAKQSLYENIVLPLSLSEDMRQKIFQGVRSSGGNVDLHKELN